MSPITNRHDIVLFPQVLGPTQEGLIKRVKVKYVNYIINLCEYTCINIGLLYISAVIKLITIYAATGNPHYTLDAGDDNKNITGSVGWLV